VDWTLESVNAEAGNGQISVVVVIVIVIIVIEGRGEGAQEGNQHEDGEAGELLGGPEAAFEEPGLQEIGIGDPDNFEEVGGEDFNGPWFGRVRKLDMENGADEDALLGDGVPGSAVVVEAIEKVVGPPDGDLMEDVAPTDFELAEDDFDEGGEAGGVEGVVAKEA